MKHNFAVIYKAPSDSFPQIFSSAAEDKDGALRAFYLNRSGQVFNVVKVPAKPPGQFKQSALAFKKSFPRA